MTLEELIEHFEEVYGVEVEMVSAGVCILYTFYQPRKKVEARMPLECVCLPSCFVPPLARVRSRARGPPRASCR